MVDIPSAHVPRHIDYCSAVFQIQYFQLNIKDLHQLVAKFVTPVSRRLRSFDWHRIENGVMVSERLAMLTVYECAMWASRIS